MDATLIDVLSNLGTGGVVIILIVLGYLVPKPAHAQVLTEAARKDEEIDKLHEALALERQRSNDATAAAAVTNQLLGAITTLAAENRAAEQEHARGNARGPLTGPTGKDGGS